MRKSNSESRRVDGVTRGDNLIYALLQTVLEDVHVPRPVVGDVVGEERVGCRVDHEGPVMRLVDRVRREGQRRGVAAHVGMQWVLSERRLRAQV